MQLVRHGVRVHLGDPALRVLRILRDDGRDEALGGLERAAGRGVYADGWVGLVLFDSEQKAGIVDCMLNGVLR